MAAHVATVVHYHVGFYNTVGHAVAVWRRIVVQRHHAPSGYGFLQARQALVDTLLLLRIGSIGYVERSCKLLTHSLCNIVRRLAVSHTAAYILSLVIGERHALVQTTEEW